MSAAEQHFGRPKRACRGCVVSKKKCDVCSQWPCSKCVASEIPCVVDYAHDETEASCSANVQVILRDYPDWLAWTLGPLVAHIRADHERSLICDHIAIHVLLTQLLRQNHGHNTEKTLRDFNELCAFMRIDENTSTSLSVLAYTMPALTEWSEEALPSSIPSALMECHDIASNQFKRLQCRSLFFRHTSSEKTKSFCSPLLEECFQSASRSDILQLYGGIVYVLQSLTRDNPRRSIVFHYVLFGHVQFTNIVLSVSIDAETCEVFTLFDFFSEQSASSSTVFGSISLDTEELSSVVVCEDVFERMESPRRLTRSYSMERFLDTNSHSFNTAKKTLTTDSVFPKTDSVFPINNISDVASETETAQNDIALSDIMSEIQRLKEIVANQVKNKQLTKTHYENDEIIGVYAMFCAITIPGFIRRCRLFHTFRQLNYRMLFLPGEIVCFIAWTLFLFTRHEKWGSVFQYGAGIVFSTSSYLLYILLCRVLNADPKLPEYMQSMLVCKQVDTYKISTRYGCLSNFARLAPISNMSNSTCGHGWRLNSFTLIGGDIATFISESEESCRSKNAYIIIDVMLRSILAWSYMRNESPFHYLIPFRTTNIVFVILSGWIVLLCILFFGLFFSTGAYLNWFLWVANPLWLDDRGMRVRFRDF